MYHFWYCNSIHIITQYIIITFSTWFLGIRIYYFEVKNYVKVHKYIYFRPTAKTCTVFWHIKQVYLNRFYSIKNTWYAIDREYFVGSKLAWAKLSTRFNFVNLACVRNYFNPEILIHGVFTLWYVLVEYGSVWSGISRARLSHSQRYMGCNDWRRSLCKRKPFNDVDRYADSYKISFDSNIFHVFKFQWNIFHVFKFCTTVTSTKFI